MSASSSLPSTKPFSTPSRPRPPRFRPAPLWLQGLSVPFDAPLGPSVPPIHLQNRILRYTMYSTRHEAASNSQQYACMAAKRAPGSQKTASKHAESRVDGAGLETALEGVGWRIRNTRAGCTTSKARISKNMANSFKSRAGIDEHPSAVENTSNLKTSGNMLNAQRLPTQASTPRSTLRPHVSGPLQHPQTSSISTRRPARACAVPNEAEPRVKPTRALCCNGPTHHDPLTRVEADHPVAKNDPGLETTRRSPYNAHHRGGEADGHLDDGLVCGAIF
ncbi:hypothetical protein DFP72DRAFT_1146752 [Ephemerocybe angulata]|uniref:Uncharacterized protein n=1 Tax=Ephemerocybe angulata TaxID=980116 RepID=A0A8H6HK18_9AGAR|nr:hypothetical protein DFP72DRAFT_1146750 [Tulosesus angulatus]KAF6748172.1 hypothetical protein DFP72DRAFT_1146752 [Tulosesus angulatus]